MLRVLRGLPVFNGRYQLQAWVARIAKNVSVDVIRARARRPVSDASLVDLDQELSSREDDLDRIIERILEQEDVRATLDLIPLHHREALLLREVDGRSHREIADAMGMSSGTGEGTDPPSQGFVPQGMGWAERRPLAGCARPADPAGPAAAPGVPPPARTTRA